MGALDLFHPAVVAWFSRELGAPTPVQSAGWPAIRGGGHTLIAAPTGAGKTLAAFLCAIDDLLRARLDGALGDEARVLYVSPLKALGNDIERNLQVPLRGIHAELEAQGLACPEIRVMVRSGDTPAAQRAQMLRRPPHVVVTTPESFYLLLTSQGGRRLLSTIRTVIVDEIHALLPSKRGSHLALSLARLERLVSTPFNRIGLSATQKPLERVAQFLTGRDEHGAQLCCNLVDLGHRRELDIQLEMPGSPLEAAMSGEVWEEIYESLAQRVREHRTTLIFVNTRRVAERVSRHLAIRLGDGKVTAHHGSLSKEQRLASEQDLKHGKLQALVATASLELGIDIGTVDLVCQLGSPHSISACIQRVGRAGHRLGAVPKGRLIPLSRDDLVECAALINAVRSGELDQISFPEAPLDILAQQIVATVASEEEVGEAELWAWFRRAEPYRALPRELFDDVVRMLSEGFSVRRGRRGAHLHRDAVHGKLRPRRGARLAAITCGGAIADTFDYDVVLEPTGQKVGTLNEDFAIESSAGDIFQLGNASWKILKVDPGVVRVADAFGQPPTIPFWLGEAPSRSHELSRAVSRLREHVNEVLERASGTLDAAMEALKGSLQREYGLDDAAAHQLADYLGQARYALGTVPTQQTLVLERFFDESGGMQLVLHSPFGARINRAWGLSLRKTFCQRFNFELQAAATEDALVLSLGPTHSFELKEVFAFLHPKTVREKLVQAALVAPMFETRFRWNASRSLAVLRRRGGKPVPPRLQRMFADDLLALAFPDQAACQDNLTGPREVPDHPLVQQTLRDCLHEAMDIEAFEDLLSQVVSGDKQWVCKELTEPSPLAQEILTARPYTFLDDAPLEERRTQAVHGRRFLTAEAASELGALDPAAIVRVCEEAWPNIRDEEELHDGLLVAGFFTELEMAPHLGFAEKLRSEGRVVHTKGRHQAWVSVERYPEWQAVHGVGNSEPDARVPTEFQKQWSREDAVLELCRSRLEVSGPLTCEELRTALSVPAGWVEVALLSMQSEGFVLKGSFRTAEGGGANSEPEWCERGLLARIHRYTLQKLRREIEPVTAADFTRFLFRFQHVCPESRMRGPEGLARVVAQLSGFSGAAAAWEGDLLPARVADYDPQWLDSLCLSGQVVWARGPRLSGGRSSGPIRATPVSLVARTAYGAWRGGGPPETGSLGDEASRVAQVFSERGACFFDELVGESGLMRTQVERAIAELVASGQVTSDSFMGLRALLVPADKRNRVGRGGGAGVRHRVAPYTLEAAGRWSPLPSSVVALDGADLEAIAWGLLNRYGVVFRALLARESSLPPWRELLRTFRRLEARGEIRGGRFVSRFSGEQYALTGAVAELRTVRRTEGTGGLVSVSAADPLNLAGILSPGPRVPALAANRVLYRDGVPIGVKLGEHMDIQSSLEQACHGDARRVLARHAVPRELRGYLKF